MRITHVKHGCDDSFYLLVGVGRREWQTKYPLEIGVCNGEVGGGIAIFLSIVRVHVDGNKVHRNPDTRIAQLLDKRVPAGR